MKHPGDKKGNNVYCELPPEAVAIVKSMPQEEEWIFPYSTDAISAAFTRACKILGIEDLRFHDLRHEGISQLFEGSNHSAGGGCFWPSKLDEPKEVYPYSDQQRQV